MRFNAEIYEKVFPRTTETQTVIESAVETFKPTEEEQKAKDNKPGDLKAIEPDILADDPNTPDNPETNEVNENE